jgi:hypothetical protein
MTIYYQGNAVVITHEVFLIALPEPTRYQLSELDDVVIVRRDRSAFRVVIAFIAVGAISVVLATLPKASSALVLGSGVMLLGVSAVIIGACWRLSPRVYELQADYRGQRILLYSSSDARTFGQVRRALLRALEARRQRTVHLA